ncbi:MAG: hypothetical protein IPK19_10430 [Chloroflexi bacterium]|nr:hypothetical protein [Chloroflexota bacterium]
MEAGNHVGNGPYMLVEWVHQRMVFEQNPYYNGIWKDNRLWIALSSRHGGCVWNQRCPSF